MAMKGLFSSHDVVAHNQQGEDGKDASNENDKDGSSDVDEEELQT